MNYSITEFYTSNKRTAEAKAFYRQMLEKGIASRFWLNSYAERLVTILIEEKDLAEAERTLKQYLDPGSDKELYAKLSAAITAGTGND